MENKIKKIAIIADGYPSEGSQAFVFIKQLVDAMVDLGIEATIIAPQSITKSIVRNVKRLPKKSFIAITNGTKYLIYRPPYISTGNYFRSLSSFLNYVRSSQIIKLLKKDTYDAIYCHFWHNAIPVYKYALQNHIPLFVACGEGDNAMENMHNSLTDEQRINLRNAMTGVISVSSENKRKSVDFGFIDKEDIEVYPNCVNTDVFKPLDSSSLKKKLGIADDDFTVVFVGSFIHRKGADRLSDAITKLKDNKIKSIFIGKPFANDCVEPNCDGIVFKGIVKHDDIPLYINCGDVFVLPTLKEGCCNAIVEALAICKPVISSNGPFNDDILDDNNSIRVDPMSVDEIATAIKTMKDSHQMRDNMTKYLYSYRENYSITARAQNIINFINKQIVKKFN